MKKALDEAQDKLNAIRTSHGALKTDLDGVVQMQQKAERAVFELEKQKAI